MGLSQGCNKPGGRNGERLYQRTWTSNLLQTARKSCFLLDTSIVIKLSVWIAQNFEAGHKFTLFLRAQTCCRREGTCQQENQCAPSLCSFNPTLPTGQEKSIPTLQTTPESQHSLSWGMKTKATIFTEEKATQMRTHRGFRKTKKLSACPTFTHVAEMFGITVWI